MFATYNYQKKSMKSLRKHEIFYKPKLFNFQNKSFIKTNDELLFLKHEPPKKVCHNITKNIKQNRHENIRIVPNKSKFTNADAL